MSNHEDEPAAEFSYTRSDVLRQAPADRKSKPTTISDYSTESYSSSTTPLALQPPQPPHRRDMSRDSYMSHISQFSEQEHSVAQPVSVTVVDKNVNPVNRVASVKRLETIAGARQDKVGPDVVYNTDIASSIPPRSSQRPMSEYVVAQNPRASQNFHQHSRSASLAISDDLDKLMEKANTLTNKTFLGESGEDLEKPLLPPKGHTRHQSGHSSLYSGDARYQSNINSQESFKTAPNSDNADSAGSRSPPKRFQLPPRPSAENLVRAREVSSQMEKKAQRSNSFGIEEVSNYSAEDKTTTYSRANTSETLLRQHVPFPTSSEGPAAQSEAPLHESSSLHESNDSSSPKVDEAEPVTVSRANSAARRITPYPQEEVASSNYDDLAERQPQEKAVPAQQEIPQTGPDDAYYDVDDLVLADPPARAKSVKDSTKHPKKSKKKSKKRVKSGPGQLKPFSYHTLISLLESINGTIIGEEFDQLNLPIKEKQLIEKIIDSLSRLTSDMVLDEQRYEIGITRLETALRVLEGFM